MLQCSNTSISLNNEQRQIVNNLSLTLLPGEIHAIIGPNGSGKSTLVQAIAGNPSYNILSGSIIFNDIDITSMIPHQRAKKGIFLSFQQPPTIPGLTVFSLLKEMYQALKNEPVEVELLYAMALGYCRQLKLDTSFLERGCHEGFSGGEKKRFELLQLLFIKPQCVLLDEIDSGLDIDGLQLVIQVINQIKKENPKTIFLIITHYQRLFSYIAPDAVHLMKDGTIMQSGSALIINELEKKGYDGYFKAYQS